MAYSTPFESLRAETEEEEGTGDSRMTIIDALPAHPKASAAS